MCMKKLYLLTLVRVATASMIASLSFVVVILVLYELWRIIR